MIEVGDKVRSKSEPKLGTMKVLAIQPLEEVVSSASLSSLESAMLNVPRFTSARQIVTVKTPYGADDTDMDDLILVEKA